MLQASEYLGLCMASKSQLRGCASSVLLKSHKRNRGHSYAQATRDACGWLQSAPSARFGAKPKTQSQVS